MHSNNPQKSNNLAGFYTARLAASNKEQYGKIHSIFIRDSNIFAVIKKNPEYLADSDSNPITFFNMVEGTNPNDYPLCLLAVPIVNLPPNNIQNIKSFIGYNVRVIIEQGVATEALILPTPILTLTDKSTILQAMQSKEGCQILTPQFKANAEALGLDVDLLKLLEEATKYDSEKFEDKLVTIEGEAQQFRDTSNPLENEVVIADNSIYNSKPGTMKDNNCHIAPRFLSGK